MTIKWFNFPVAVVQIIHRAAAIYNTMKMIQSKEAIFDWSLLSLRNYCQRGSQKLFHLCPGSAAMISAVLPNTTFWLPRESTSSITSEGGTQILAKLYQLGQLILAITPIRWCGLCLRFNKQLCESVSFRGRAQGINFWQRYLVCFQSPYLVPCGSRTSVCEGVWEYLSSHSCWSLNSGELFIPGASSRVYAHFRKSDHMH